MLIDAPAPEFTDPEPGVLILEKFVPGVNPPEVLRLIEEPGVEVPDDNGLKRGDLGVENDLLFVVEEKPKPLGPKPVADSGKLKKLPPIELRLVVLSIPNPAQVEDGRSQLLFLGENDAVVEWG